MGNPIFDTPMRSAQPSSDRSGILGMIDQIRNSPNPNTAMQNLISTNPQVKSVMDYISHNGGDARSAFYNLAAQKGVDPNTILNQLK